MDNAISTNYSPDTVRVFFLRERFGLPVAVMSKTLVSFDANTVVVDGLYSG
jgi:hypothetical protein